MHELAQYVVSHYPELMTAAESAAYQRLCLTFRATGGDTSSDAQAKVASSIVNRRLYPNAFSDDPDVLALAGEGIDLFRLRVAERIQDEYGAELAIPYCARCKALLPEPGASCAQCASGQMEAGAGA